MVLTAAGCGTRRIADAGVDMPMPEKGQVWQLVSMRGRDVKRGTMVTLTLNTETGNMHGMAQCNSYYADFRLRPQANAAYSLTLSNMGSSETSCPDADMNAEYRYFSLLAKADALAVTEYTMTLYSKGKEILKYELQ